MRGGGYLAVVCLVWLVVGGCGREAPRERLVLSKLSAAIDGGGALSSRLSGEIRVLGVVGDGASASVPERPAEGIAGWTEFLKLLDSVPPLLELDVHGERDWWSDVEPIVRAFAKLRVKGEREAASSCGPGRAVIRVGLAGRAPGTEWILPVGLLEEPLFPSPSISSASPMLTLSVVRDEAGVPMLQYRQYRASPTEGGGWRTLIDAVAHSARNDRASLGLTLRRTTSPSGAAIHVPVSLVATFIRDLMASEAACEFQFIDLFGWS